MHIVGQEVDILLPRRLWAALARVPERKRGVVHVNIHLGGPLLHVRLCIRHALVVEGWANFCDKEFQQTSRSHVANGLVHVFAKIALQ